MTRLLKAFTQPRSNKLASLDAKRGNLLDKHKRSFDGSGVRIATLWEEAHGQNHLASQTRCARQGRGENCAPRRLLSSSAHP